MTNKLVFGRKEEVILLSRRRDTLLAVLVSFCLTAAVFTVVPAVGPPSKPYDPFFDYNNDGKIGPADFAYFSTIYGAQGTAPVAKAVLDYDSGWINITDKCGQYFNITHNLNSTDVIVDITGKTTTDEEVHQKNLGGDDYSPEWSRTYGGPLYDSPGRSIIQTGDEGYVMVGSLRFSDARGDDFWLIKTDANGNVMWNRTYDKSGSDWGDCMVQTNDGGYALVGRTSASGHQVGWLIKTDSLGNEQWNKTYSTTTAAPLSWVIQTDDGGYALSGFEGPWPEETDFLLVKTDSYGNMEWNKTYGGANLDESGALVQTSDGGYAIAGSTRSFGAGDWDLWLVKTDPSGGMEWNKTYGGTGGDGANSIIQTSDGGYALSGDTASFGAGSFDFWLVRTDENGNAMWNKTYGGTGNDYALCMVPTIHGGYAIAGYTNSFGAGGYDFWLVCTDSDGNMEWNKTYGGSNNDGANGVSITQTDDGGYALFGDTSSFGVGSYDLWLIKTETWRFGMVWTDSTSNSITLYRGTTDPDWNFVRVRIWKIKESP